MQMTHYVNAASKLKLSGPQVAGMQDAGLQISDTLAQKMAFLGFHNTILALCHRMESAPSAVCVQKVLREIAVRPTLMTVTQLPVKMEVPVR